MIGQVQTTPAEQVSVDVPARHLRRMARAQAATIAVVSMLVGIDGLLIPLMPIEGRLPAYTILIALMAFGGVALGVFDLAVGRTLGRVVAGAHDLHRVVADRASELAQLNSELQRRERQRSELFATMSHELRTPLNAILGFSRALLDGIDGPLNTDQRDDALQIHDAGRGLLGIVNGVLDLARLESGTVVLTPEPLAVGPVIEEVLAMLSPLADARRLRLSADLPLDAPRVLADEDRLRLSLVNLVGNAIKFTDKGSVTVRASYDARTVSIDVSDTGIGIAPAAQELIFQPFRQAKQSDTRRHGGTGLGLAIVRQSAELMNGRIWVESEEGVGSIFHLALPVAPSLTAEDVEPLSGSTRADTLMISDDDSSTEIVAALGRAGATAMRAAGQGWRQTAQDVDARLVMIDLLRPRAGAWQILADLRSDARWHGVQVGVFGVDHGRGRALIPAALDFVLEPDLDGQLLRRLDTLLLEYSVDPDGPMAPVVLVSADPVWRGRIAVRLARHRQAVIEASSAAQAIDIVREQPLGALVLDLLLPSAGIVGLLGRLEDDAALRTLPVMLIGPSTLTPSQQQSLRRATDHWLQLAAAPVAALAVQITGALDRAGTEPDPLGGW